MFSVRALLTLTVAGLVAVVAGGLTLAAGGMWPQALLTAGGAFGGVLGLLPRLIAGDRD